MISADVLAAYDASRAPGTDRSVICHAPFVSLNFDQSGKVTACCYNRHYVLGTYPEQSVGEIWTGEPARALRDAFLTGANAPGCDRCFDQLKNRNFSGALMRNFDRYTAGRLKNLVRHGHGPARAAGTEGPPLVLEFEISNTCTLECVMCGGHWSSAIRARREKLPPLPNPYDRRFVEQIEEFIPTIVAARFLGGEPFLITRYYEIWDSIRRLNPSAEISITTSGAVLPERPRLMLEELRANIIVSLDGITPATYESIRRNARFDQVMENIAFFRDYTRRRHTVLAVAVCPMTHNWHELREIVDFCEEREITVYFNTVTFPIESALAALPEPRLLEVIARLEADGRASRSWTAATRAQWEGLINQLHGWMDDKRAFLRHCAGVTDAVRSFASLPPGADDAASPLHGLEPSIGPFVLASEIQRERERASLGAATLDAAFLPQPPLALWSEGEAPSAPDLLRAAHLVWRFVKAADHPDPKGGLDAGGPGVVEEHQRLRASLDRLRDSPDTRATSDRLGDWIRERLQLADTPAVFSVVEQTLESFANYALLFADPSEARRRLEEEWERLGVEDIDDSDRTRIRMHFDRLASSHSVTKFLKPDAAAGSDLVVVRRIRDVRDLSAALHASQLFHLCFGPPADYDVFRGRLDMIRGLLTPERTDVIVKKLQQSDVTQIYTFISTVSDETFAGAIGATAQ